MKRLILASDLLAMSVRCKFINIFDSESILIGREVTQQLFKFVVQSWSKVPNNTYVDAKASAAGINLNVTQSMIGPNVKPLSVACNLTIPENGAQGRDKN